MLQQSVREDGSPEREVRRRQNERIQIQRMIDAIEQGPSGENNERPEIMGQAESSASEFSDDPAAGPFSDTGDNIAQELEDEVGLAVAALEVHRRATH